MELSCPRCQAKLTERRIRPEGAPEQVAVDLCASCGGLWLDRGEAEAICPTVAYLERRHVEISLVGQIRGGIMKCPRCGGMPYQFPLGDMEVDYCSGCGGVWLDAPELLKGRAKLEDGWAPDLSGPYRAMQRTVSTEYTDCADCRQRELAEKMYMSGRGLLCFQCYGAGLLEDQQRRAEASVQAETPDAGGLIRGLRRLFEGLQTALKG